MTEMKKLLDRAYLNLSKLSVSGEAVMLMALVMQDMKAAYKLADEQDQPEKKEADC